MIRRSLAGMSVLAALALFVGLEAPAHGSTSAAGLRFVDVTTIAGLAFEHFTGAFGRKYLPETLGSGVVVFDADGDSLQDVLLPNGTSWPGQARQSARDRAVVPEQGRRGLRRHHVALRSRWTGVRHGRRRRRFRQRRTRGRDHHRSGPEPSLSATRAAGSSSMSPTPRGLAVEAGSAPRRSGSTTTATGFSTC